MNLLIADFHDLDRIDGQDDTAARRGGSGRSGGSVAAVAPDFDAVPDGFEAYLP